MPTPDIISPNLEAACKLVSDLKKRVSTSIFGQEQLIEESLCCLIAGGHILMTGAPGLAKTTLVRVFARYLNLNYGRIQFTPDLLPSDIVGSEILNIDVESGRRNFEFAKGPVFVNMLLADEINRASPRTQSALLEAMQERTVTVAGKNYKLPQPFMVFATQNPFESEGAFPLPEAQLDRFLLHTLVAYPDQQAEQKILNAHASNELVGESLNSLDDTSNQLTEEDIQLLFRTGQSIQVPREILELILELVRSTRPEDELCPEELKPAIWYGAGPRAGISLISVARALAMLEQSECVRWSHVKKIAFPVLRHRVRLSIDAMQDQMGEDSIISNLLDRLESKYKLTD